MLYFLNRQSGKIGLKLALMDNEAKVVLMEDGVFLNVNSLKGKTEIYALKDHIEKRGLLDKSGNIKLISYDDLVDLINENRVVNF